MTNAGFSIRDNYDFLTGEGLGSIELSIDAVEFHFARGQRMQIFSAFEHFSAATGATTTFYVGKSGQNLAIYNLLMRTPISATPESEDRLTLVFDNGDRLTLIRFAGKAESMIIRGPNNQLFYVIE